MEEHVKIAGNYCKGIYECDLEDSLWVRAFKYLESNNENFEFDKNKVHTLWTVYGGHIRRKVKDDSLVLSILKRSLPGYIGEPMTLYRGECRFLYDDKKIGFCWTPDIEVAKKFASGLNSIESGGVLLQAFAPQLAIMASPNAHSAKQMREFEYTCDPTRLECIKVLETYEKRY